jgi:hypothetical protein
MDPEFRAVRSRIRGGIRLYGGRMNQNAGLTCQPGGRPNESEERTAGGEVDAAPRLPQRCI